MPWLLIILWCCTLIALSGPPAWRQHCVVEPSNKTLFWGSITPNCQKALERSVASPGDDFCWKLRSANFSTCCKHHGHLGNPDCFFHIFSPDVNLRYSAFRCCFAPRPLCATPDGMASNAPPHMVFEVLHRAEAIYGKHDCTLTYHEDLLNTQLDCGESRLVKTGGIGLSDIELMIVLSQRMSPKWIFIVGNGFGFSTVIFSLLFSNSSIDVIEAEVEGDVGSKLTRQIALEEEFDVRLTIGYSPEDTPRAMRSPAYKLVFIDGLHTESQLFHDVKRMNHYLDDYAVFILHDVDNAGLHIGVAAILERLHGLRYLRYQGSQRFANHIGTGLLVHWSHIAAFCDIGYVPYWADAMQMHDRPLHERPAA